MRKFIAEREEKEDGFTLIELMVVVLIMGILMAIAIPTFLSTTNGANKSAATSNLTNSLTDAKAYYDNNGQTFTSTSALITSLQGSEPNFNFTSGSNPGENNGVGVTVPTTNTAEVLLVSQAKGTNECYFIDDLEQSGTAATDGFSTPGTMYAKAAGTSSGCTVPAADTAITGNSGTGAWAATEGTGW